MLEIQWWPRHSPRTVGSSAFMGKGRCRRNNIKIVSPMQEMLWQKTCLRRYRAHNKSVWRGRLRKPFLPSFVHYVPYAAQTVLSLESHLSFSQCYFITPGLSFFVCKMGDDKIIVMVVKGDRKTSQGLEQHPAHNSAIAFRVASWCTTGCFIRKAPGILKCTNQPTDAAATEIRQYFELRAILLQTSLD